MKIKYIIKKNFYNIKDIKLINIKIKSLKKKTKIIYEEKKNI